MAIHNYLHFDELVVISSLLKNSYKIVMAPDEISYLYSSWKATLLCRSDHTHTHTWVIYLNHVLLTHSSPVCYTHSFYVFSALQWLQHMTVCLLHVSGFQSPPRKESDYTQCPSSNMEGCHIHRRIFVLVLDWGSDEEWKDSCRHHQHILSELWWTSASDCWEL